MIDHRSGRTFNFKFIDWSKKSNASKSLDHSPKLSTLEQARKSCETFGWKIVDVALVPPHLQCEMKRKKEEQKQPKKGQSKNVKPFNNKSSFQNKKRREEDDEEITSESTVISDLSLSDEDGENDIESSSSSEKSKEDENAIKESHDEMRARVARQYLEKLDALYKAEDDGEEEEEDDKINSHLHSEYVSSLFLLFSN
jgi:hypothetical protein